MLPRIPWLERVKRAWERRPIVWLSGVRRVGKTTLARMLSGIRYLNCDLPSVRRRLRDPELFLEGLAPGTRLVLDEVHHLEAPSELLKLLADTRPDLRVLATGSSTLAATSRFRDTLTGRKVSVHLTPVLWRECRTAPGLADLDRRLLHGGLPEPLLAARKDPEFFAEWIDSFYARDIQALFGIRRREGFLALLRLILRWSGGLVDYTRLASESELSRPTVKAHLEAMAVAHAVHLLRPFHGGGSREIVSRPKCYAFDTGFVTYERGWDILREDDRGVLWEHLVLDELRFGCPDDALFYWRDKAGHEVDFVIRRGRGRVDAIECKIDPDRLATRSLASFRRLHPEGENYVVVPKADPPYRMRAGGMVLTVCEPRHVPPARGAVA